MAFSSWISQLNNPGVGFGFIDFEGTPEPIIEMFERVRREGVRGTGYWRKEAAGTPFEVTTTIDTGGLILSKSLQASYGASRGQVFNLYWQGVWFNKVFIYYAKPLAVKTVHGTAGGSMGGGSIARAKWKMEAVV